MRGRLPVAPLRPTNRKTVEPRASAWPPLSRPHDTRIAEASSPSAPLPTAVIEDRHRHKYPARAPYGARPHPRGIAGAHQRAAAGSVSEVTGQKRRHPLKGIASRRGIPTRYKAASLDGFVPAAVAAGCSAHRRRDRRPDKAACRSWRPRATAFSTRRSQGAARVQVSLTPCSNSSGISFDQPGACSSLAHRAG